MRIGVVSKELFLQRVLPRKARPRFVGLEQVSGRSLYKQKQILVPLMSTQYL